jgi:hypothetical protein
VRAHGRATRNAWYARAIARRTGNQRRPLLRRSQAEM